MPKLLKQTLFLLLFGSICHPSFALEHDLFLKAEAELRKGYITRYERTLTKLGDHPLVPYLEAKRIQRKFYRTPIADIDAFLKEHPDTPYANELRRRWLHHLARKQKWHLYLDYYQPTESLVRQCHRVRALGITGQVGKAYVEGKKLWLKGKSLPKACDPVFANWKRQNLLTEELIWQRLVNALEKRQYRLVSYLRKKLPKSRNQDYRNLRKYWRKPEKVFTSNKVMDLPANARRILLARAIKREPDHLLNPHFLGLQQGLEKEEIEGLYTLGFYSAAKSKNTDTFEWYYMAAKQEVLNDELKIKFLEGAVLNQNWPLFTHLFKLMPELIGQDARWHYWQGRALSIMGAHPSASEQHFEVAAQERDYYGFMASQELGISPTMNHNPTYVPASVVQATRLDPTIKRSLALFELGRVTPARREWHHAYSHMDTEGRKAMAVIAGRYEWADRAILTLAKLRDWHDLQLRFPLAHSKEVNRAASRTKLEPNWIYGIARQESAFQHDARSSAGAMGLMQLMPRTARSVSKRYRMRYSKSRLLKPTYNLEIGSRYMRLLLNRYDGNRVLATAAYNAGPHNVNRWLKRFKGPVDLWIENIPFAETREYVQKVLAYSTIYSYRLGELQPILDRKTLNAWQSLHEPTVRLSKADTGQPPNKG